MSICGGFKFCDKLRINSKISFSFCAGKRNLSPSSDSEEENIILINSNHKIYPNLVPVKKYLFLKVLSKGLIISVSGDLFEFFNLTCEDLLNKKIIHIEKKTDLFIECIEPLYRSSLVTKLVYQFDFGLKKKKFTCSIYPCMVLNQLLSIDIVIRNSQNIIINDAVIKEYNFV